MSSYACYILERYACYAIDCSRMLWSATLQTLQQTADGVNCYACYVLERYACYAIDCSRVLWSATLQQTADGVNCRSAWPLTGVASIQGKSATLFLFIHLRFKKILKTCSFSLTWTCGLSGDTKHPARSNLMQQHAV